MKLKGIVNIKITDAEGNVKQEITQNNLIPDQDWIEVLGYYAPSGYLVRNISIATDTSTPTATNDQVTGVIGTCYTPAGVTNPLWVTSSDPPYGTLTGRIDPTGTSRTFTTVALTGLGSGGTQSVSTTQQYAKLLLSIPCTQGVADYVNITYTIQFLSATSAGIVNSTLARYEFGGCLFGQSNFHIDYLWASFCTANLKAINIPVTPQVLVYQNGNVPIFWTSGSSNPTNFKWNYGLTSDKTKFLGTIINATPQGQSNNGLLAYGLSQFTNAKQPFQTGFKHGMNSVTPFFDPTYPASSQGLLYLAGTWTGRFPVTFKILFNATGATGTATYNFQMMNHVGFNGNTFSCIDNISIYRVPDIQPFTGVHGYRDEDFDVQQLSESVIVQFDDTGVSTIDLLDGTFNNWDATTTPALPATQIRQVAIDTVNQLIYVGCRQTGLYVINVAANTVTILVGSACYGVDVGRNQVAVALCSGGLYRSTNWSTPVSFTYIGISDGNWGRVLYLKCDPSNTNDQIAIVAFNGTSSNFLLWHQFSDNTNVLGYSNSNIQNYAAGLGCSSINSKWVYYTGGGAAYALTYGNSSLGTSYQCNYKNINHSIYGNANYSKISFYQDNFIGFQQFYGGGISLSYNYYGNTSFNIPLIGGLFLSNQAIRQLFNNNSLLWTSYGWNGSSWVQGNTGSKTTHADAETLVDGLTIEFADQSTSPSFVQNEFVTQSVCYGLLKDNATDMQINRAWYSKATHNDTISATTIATTVTLSAVSNPLFRRVDTDTFQGSNFYINGTLATKLWLDGTAPAATEVSMQSSGNGVLTFNSADIGKTLTGNYIWIEF